MARWYRLAAGPPGAWAMCSSRTERATLLSSGERIDPYEQCRVMPSADLFVPGEGGVGWFERCA